MKESAVPSRNLPEYQRKSDGTDNENNDSIDDDELYTTALDFEDPVEGAPKSVNTMSMFSLNVIVDELNEEEEWENENIEPSHHDKSIQVELSVRPDQDENIQVRIGFFQLVEFMDFNNLFFRLTSHTTNV